MDRRLNCKKKKNLLSIFSYLIIDKIVRKIIYYIAFKVCFETIIL